MNVLKIFFFPSKRHASSTPPSPPFSIKLPSVAQSAKVPRDFVKVLLDLPLLLGPSPERPLRCES